MHTNNNNNCIKTNILQLDTLLCGGLKTGEVIEVFGDSACGKTMLALNIIQNYQQCGLNCAFFDTEYSINIRIAKNIGININELLLVQNNIAEQTLQILISLIETNKIQLIVLDSLAGITYYSDIDYINMLQIYMHNIYWSIKKNKCTLVIINQLRYNKYYKNEYSYMFHVIANYIDIRIKLDIDKYILVNNNIIGNKILCSVLKNNIYNINKNLYIKFYLYNDLLLIDLHKTVIDSVKMGVIRKHNKQFYFQDYIIGKNLSEIIVFLEEHTNVLYDIINTKPKHMNVFRFFRAD